MMDIKKKLQDEIAVLDHEFKVELPKEILKARAPGDLSENAEPASGEVSTTSPIGRALLGKEVGDVVRVQSPGGVKEFEILKLTTIHDRSEEHTSELQSLRHLVCRLLL